MGSYLPYLLLFGAGLIACLAGATIRLWQTSAARLRQIRILNADLDHQLQSIFEVGRIGTWLLDLPTGVLAGHGKLPELYGLQPADSATSMDSFLASVHPDDRALVSQINEETIAGTLPNLAMEFRVVWPDGTIHWLSARGQVVRDADGTPLQLHGINVDITARKEAELAHESSEQRFRQLADAMPQMVWTASPDGNFDYYNQRWYDFTGLTFEQTKDWGWQLVLHPEDLRHCVDRWTHSFTTGEPFEVEYRFLRASDGAYRWHLGRATPIRNAEGAVLRWFGTCTDIEDYKLAEAEVHALNETLESRVEQRTTELADANLELALNSQKLADQTRRAEEANRAKSEFLATMSHEIRTPMNGVVGMTELLLLTELSQEQREYAELLLTSADSLLAIINDILDFSKVESGKMHLETIDFVLRTAIEEVADLLAVRAQAKGLEMACLITHDIPIVVRGDPGRLRQVLTNLLGNAIKFTETGEVVLRAKLAEDSGDDVTIRFDIADTGIGLSPEGRGRLFQSFSQADGSTTRKFGGTGLGLAISKRLAELMGGEIGVESEPGKGSTFWFTVKLSKIPETQVVVPILRDDLRGLYALAVDDNQTNLQLVRAQTRTWGMVCDITSQGSEALEMIEAASQHRAYDIGILDMQMPGMDGLELAQAIKCDPANEKMKLILMTSMAQRGHAARSEQVGIAGYLNKPVRQAQLYDCLRMVMGPSQASPQAAQPPRFVTAHSLKEMNALRRPRVLLAEDNQTNQMAAVRMLEMLGYQVDVAVNGIEAVDACRDVDYGIVLMDNQMPEMDGLTATREVRKLELARGKAPVPIIALTADAMQGDREKCLAAGMNDYLSKPFKAVQLSELLERWGQLSPAVSPPQEAVAALTHDGAVDPRVFDDFRGAGGGTNDFVVKLIDQYLAEACVRVAELTDAVERRDAPALRFATHSLKGTSSTVGANRLAALCEELERLARDSIFDRIPALVIEVGDEFIRVREALRTEQGSTA